MSSKGTKRLSLKRKSFGTGNLDELSKKCGGTKKGHCPLCQMPLAILNFQTEAWHYEECFAVNRTGQKECQKGLSCDSTIISHYFKETHLRLAAQRSNLQAALDNEVQVSAETESKTPESVPRAPALPIKLLASTVENSTCNVPSKETPKQSPRKDPVNVITKLYADGSCKVVAVPINGAFRDQSEITARNGPREQPKKTARNGTENQPDKSLKNGLKSQAKITSFFQHSGSTKVEKCPTSPSTSSGASSKILKPPPKIITLPENSDSALIQGAKSWSGEASGRQPRRCPFYKKLVGVPFVVDAFSYGVIPGITAYFLSHFHSDHYMGLNSKFGQTLFCSKVTANLVKLKLRVSESLIHPLPLDEPHIVRGVEVTLIEANHCPGAVMFLFRCTDGRCILHTGDFRADPTMERHPALASVCLDVLYLDTTYCKPNYDFPSQQEVLEFIVQAAKKQLKWHTSMLIVCGSYTIGKERVFLALADALQRRVWASREKLRIFQCLEDSALQAVLSTDPNLATIHVLGMQQLNFKHLQDYLEKFNGLYSSLLAIKPTGWEHGSKKNVSSCLEGIIPMTRGNITIYGVPYSEHSSFGEMGRFVQNLRPARVIPTVNVAGHGAKQQMDVIQGWMKR